MQPSNLHMMAQQAAQQAAARVLAHFVPPSASASSSPSPFPVDYCSTAAHRHRVLAALQPGLFRWLRPNSPAAAGIHGSPAVFQPQCHHFNLTVMGLPASLSLPSAYTWTGSSSPCGCGPSHPYPSNSAPAHLPYPPSDGSVQRLNPHHTGQVCYRSDLR